MLLARALMTCLAISLLAGPVAGLPAAQAAECVTPEPIPLPLPNLPSSRLNFNQYKSEVKAYRNCAGETADAAVQAHYERALDQFVALIRIWGRRHSR